MKRSYLLLLSSFLACAPAFAQAAPTPIGPTRIDLQLREDFTVPDDELTAHLVAEAQNQDPAKAAVLVNDDLRWAQEQLGKIPQIHWRLGNYQSQQMADDKGWQLKGELILRAAPSVLLAQLATLQSRLQLQSLQAQPSAASQQEAAGKAQRVLLQRFLHDAQSACRDLGMSWGGVIQVKLQSPSQQSSPVFLAPAMMRTVPAPVASGQMESRWYIPLEGLAFCQK